MVQIGIQKPTLHALCRETPNLHIGSGTSKLNVHVIFVSSYFMTLISLPGCFGEP